MFYWENPFLLVFGFMGVVSSLTEMQDGREKPFTKIFEIILGGNFIVLWKKLVVW